MTHNELTELWKKQRELNQKWVDSLLDNAKKLRIQVEDILQPQNKEWKEREKNIQHRYIELINITKEDKSHGRYLSQESINEKGELIFGVRIIFDEGINVYPKDSYYDAVAIRFSDEEPQFSFYNEETKTTSDWENDMSKFAYLIISKLTDYFSFNPFKGFSKRPAIGFHRES